MAEDKKQVHDICVDKTSCREEIEKKEDSGQPQDGSYGSKPTEKLTKDVILKETNTPKNF